MKRRILTAVFISIMGILIATPSYGIINVNDFFSSIISDIQSELENIQDLAEGKIEETWTGIKEDAKAAIQSAIGEMGAPDPIASSEELKDRIENESSIYEAEQQGQALERQLALAQIQSVIGESGQEQTAHKIDQTTQISEEAKGIADAAQYMDSSQDVLKVIAGQNALVVSMLAQQRTDSLISRQDTAYSNLMLNQIAENLAAQNASKQAENTGSTSLVHELVGMSPIDPTYTEE